LSYEDIKTLLGGYTMRNIDMVNRVHHPLPGEPVFEFNKWIRLNNRFTYVGLGWNIQQGFNYDLDASILCFNKMNTITEISENICLFFKQITPNNKFEIYKDPSKIMYKIDKLNPWVSSDYHLLKELIKGADSNFEFTKKIIEMHNSVVKPNDLFLFLGDLSESELFTQNMKKAQEDLIGLCRLMNGKKIMITGNNDLCPDDFLKKCGFIEIYRDPVLLEKICFSHGPIPCKPGIINIHGHIHGNKTYWINTYGDYIDAFYGLWGGPVKLDFLTNKKTLQSYRNGCITRLDKIYQDPETTKVPGNLI
jgi:calcineurin-like phosphoesterase family protein